MPSGSILPTFSIPALQSLHNSQEIASFLVSDQRSSLAQTLIQPFIFPAFLVLLFYKWKSSNQLASSFLPLRDSCFFSHGLASSQPGHPACATAFPVSEPVGPAL